MQIKNYKSLNRLLKGLLMTYKDLLLAKKPMLLFKEILTENGTDLEPLIETALSRLISHYQKTGLAFITAFRPEYDKKVNYMRNDNLEVDLRKAHFGFSKVIGGYRDKPTQEQPNPEAVEEETFVIPLDPKIMSEEDFINVITHLGNKYNQDSVLIVTPTNGANLYYADGSIANVGTELTFSDVEEFYTQLGKRKFKFESININETTFDRCLNQSLLVKRGYHHHVKFLLKDLKNNY